MNIIPYYFWTNYESGSTEFLGFAGGETNYSVTEAYRIGAVKPGYAYYTYYHWNDYTHKVVTSSETFIEIKDTDTAHPYRYDIYRNNAGTLDRIGWNNYDTGVIQFDNMTWATGYVEIKVEIDNRAYIKPKAVVQSGGNLIFYIRFFQSIVVNKITG